MEFSNYFQPFFVIQVLLFATLFRPSDESPTRETKDTIPPTTIHGLGKDAVDEDLRQRHFQRLLANSTSIDLLNGASLLGNLGSRTGAQQEASEPMLDLVRFMTDNAQGKHFYFLRDETSNDISDPLVRIIQSHGDVVSLEYDSELDALTKMVRGNYHTGNLRNILVYCSSRNTVSVFRKITDGLLQTPTVHWYVVLKDDVMKDIGNIIKEGTQMSLALNTEDQFKLFISYINKNDRVAFEEIGWWKWKSTKTSSSGKYTYHLRKPLYRPVKEVYRDFGGRVMRSAVIDNTPFFAVVVNPDGSVKPDSGIDFNVLNALGSKLNFTYQLVITEDGRWGGEQPNGSFTGMIGKVQRGEVHFAINEITITGVRERVVDFTLPYFLESTALISRAPAEKNQAFAVFSPFTYQVWLLIVAATILAGPLITLATWLRKMYNKMDSSRMYSLSDHCFSVYRSLVVQGNEMRLRGWCQKCLYMGWFLFCFIIYALYSGTLTAVLTVPAFEKPIDSLSDLLDAVIKDGFKPVVVRGTSNEFIFSDATSGIYKQLWDVFDPKDRYVYSWDEGIDKVISGKYVFANAYLGAVIRAKRRGLHKYHFAKNTFYPQSYGMACANGAPYKTLFDSLLIQITSAGLVQKWTKDEVSKVKSADSSSSSGPGAITLVQLQAAFFILLIGYFLAAIALIVEAIIGVCSKSKTPAKDNAL